MKNLSKMVSKVTFLCAMVAVIATSVVAERQIKLEDIERDNIISEKKAAEEQRSSQRDEPTKQQLITNPSLLLKPSSFLTPKQLAQYINTNHVYQPQHPQTHQYPHSYQPHYQQSSPVQYYQTKKLIYPAKYTTKLVSSPKGVPTLSSKIPYYVRPVNYQTLAGANPLLQPVQSTIPVQQYYSPSHLHPYNSPVQTIYQQTLPSQSIAPVKAPVPVPVPVPVSVPMPVIQTHTATSPYQTAASVPVPSSENIHSPAQFVYVQPQMVPYLAHPMKINGVPYFMIYQSDASYLSPQTYNPNLQAIVQAYTPAPQTYEQQGSKLQEELQELNQQPLNQQSQTTEYRSKVQHRPQQQPHHAHHHQQQHHQLYYLQSPKKLTSHIPEDVSPTVRLSVKTKIGSSPRSLLESYVPSAVQLQYTKYKMEENNLKEQMKQLDNEREKFSTNDYNPQEPRDQEQREEEYRAVIQTASQSQSEPSQQHEEQQPQPLTLESNYEENPQEEILYRDISSLKPEDQRQFYAKYFPQQSKKPVLKAKMPQKYVIPKTTIQHGGGSSSYIDYGAQRFA